MIRDKKLVMQLNKWIEECYEELIEGGVPKRPKGPDCKLGGIAFGGSNPPPSTMEGWKNAGVAQW